MSVAPPHELVLQGYLHKQSKHLKIWRIRYFMLTKASDRLDLTTIDGKPQCRIAVDKDTSSRQAGRHPPTSPTHIQRRIVSMAAPSDVSAMLDVAIAAARAAGAHMKSHLSTSRVEKTKSSKDDLVTVVDKQCQDLVLATIEQSFPTHEFLGEENVAPGSEASARALRELASKEWLWIVDPIDGTTNFVHHRPASVVSVACAHLGDVVVGVIYDPYRDELFTAQQGEGTFLNGQPARVSHEASFSEALVGFGIGTKDSVRLPMLDCAREFSAKCRGLRLQGAAAIELAWTAAGRQSAFYELDLNSWDVAAGALLVKEAGGHVTNSDGTPFSLSTRNIVVSNNKGDIHASMLELIKKADAVNVRK